MDYHQKLAGSNCSESWQRTSACKPGHMIHLLGQPACSWVLPCLVVIHEILLASVDFDGKLTGLLDWRSSDLSNLFSEF